MSSVLNYKTNNLFNSRYPWAYFGKTNIEQGHLGNPANNALKKKESATIDLELNYRQGEKKYSDLEADKYKIASAGLWYNQHYFGISTIGLGQEQFNYEENRVIEKYREREVKHTLSYAYPFVNNYLAAGLNINSNYQTAGNAGISYSQLGLDGGISARNILNTNFNLGLGWQNLSRPLNLSGGKYLPDTKWGVGISYTAPEKWSAALDYNKAFYHEFQNISGRLKYDFISKYINISPELGAFLNKESFSDTTALFGGLNLGHEFKLDRVVQNPSKSPETLLFNYEYEELNVGENFLPISFKEISISKNFSKEQQSWQVSVSIPPFNKELADKQNIYAMFELTNENNKKFYYSGELDKANIKDSITINVKIPSGKYRVSSYYLDANKNILSAKYIDPEEKYIGICYTVEEKTITSKLELPRQYIFDIHDNYTEYQKAYLSHSECFDYLETASEIQRKASAYGSINAICLYLDENQKIQSEIIETDRQIETLRIKKENLEKTLEEISKKILSDLDDNNQEGSLLYQTTFKEKEETIAAINTLVESKAKPHSRIKGTQQEIDNLLRTINRLNIIPELIGLEAAEQISVIIESKKLFTERHLEIQKQQRAGIKLDRIIAMNHNFNYLYGQQRNFIKKIIENDLEQQNKNPAINATDKETLVNGILNSYKLTAAGDKKINELAFGEKITYRFPFHDKARSKWLTKKGELKVNYNETINLTDKDYPDFVIKKARLKGDKILVKNSLKKPETVSYKTTYREHYQPLYFGFNLNYNIIYPLNKDKKQEHSGGLSFSIRGF